MSEHGVSDVREIVGAVAFEEGGQFSFRISRMELERNSPEQLGSLILERIATARRFRDKVLEMARESLKTNRLV